MGTSKKAVAAAVLCNDFPSLPCYSAVFLGCIVHATFKMDRPFALQPSTNLDIGRCPYPRRSLTMLSGQI